MRQVYFLFPVSHLMNMLGFLISWRRMQSNFSKNSDYLKPQRKPGKVPSFKIILNYFTLYLWQQGKNCNSRMSSNYRDTDIIDIKSLCLNMNEIPNSNKLKVFETTHCKNNLDKTHIFNNYIKYKNVQNIKKIVLFQQEELLASNFLETAEWMKRSFDYGTTRYTLLQIRWLIGATLISLLSKL